MVATLGAENVHGDGLTNVAGRSMPVRWSVNVVAEGDRVVSREEVVELADAVAAFGGIASGIGTPRYGAQLIVEAEDRETAMEHATAEFLRAAQRAGLPSWPVVNVGAISDAEDELGDLE
jgi:hypothetical protein